MSRRPARAWNGGSPEAARQEADQRALQALETLRRLHRHYVAHVDPTIADLPVGSDDVPGWLYLPIEDVVILMDTARKIASVMAARGHRG